MYKRKDLLGLKDLSADEIQRIILSAAEMKKVFALDVKKINKLGNKSVATLFYENSTRTKISFENAAKMLGAGVVSLSVATSSVKKGESLIDTGYTLDALMADAIIIRHNMSGAPHLLARNVKASVINGGDGTNEHPTQALLDFLTMYERFGDFKDLKVVIAGDIKHSRVARSNIWGLTKLGASVTCVGPGTLMPAEIDKMGVTVCYDIEKAVEGANVIMGLRLQLERQQSGLLPSAREYNNFYGISEKLIKAADAGVIVMHPGPINREVEISTAVADGEESVILDQVTNGVAVRMAVLDMLLTA